MEKSISLARGYDIAIADMDQLTCQIIWKNTFNVHFEKQCKTEHILSSLTFDSKDTQDSTVQHINKLMPVQNLKQEAFKGTVLK